MLNRRDFGLLVSASFHAILLVAIAGVPQPASEPVSDTPRRTESVEVDIVDLSDLRDHAFNFDIEKIARRVDALFPFVQPISLVSRLQAKHEAVKKGDSRLFVMESHLAKRAPALKMSAMEMQSVLDSSWSRRDRWDSFQQISALIDHFNPDEGDLPLLLNRYVNENLLQPFHAAQNPEPKLWALLSVAADHSRFLQFITEFLNGMPTSKTGTELLLLLDKLVQANLHTAQSLVDLDVVEGLKWTKSLSPNGAEMLLGLHAFHERALGKLGLWDESALAARYDQVRLDILDHLLRTTPAGYRADAARFLIGEIYWNQGRTANAVNTWRTIAADSGDECFSVCSELVEIVKSAPINHARIEAALGDHTRHWTYASFARLRQFGFRFDTF